METSNTKGDLYGRLTVVKGVVEEIHSKIRDYWKIIKTQELICCEIAKKENPTYIERERVDVATRRGRIAENNLHIYQVVLMDYEVEWEQIEQRIKLIDAGNAECENNKKKLEQIKSQGDQ